MIKQVALNLGTWLAYKSGEVEKINVLVYGMEYIISSLFKIINLERVKALMRDGMNNFHILLDSGEHKIPVGKYDH